MTVKDQTSTTPGSRSSETSIRLEPADEPGQSLTYFSRYQRKVPMTLTRTQAELIRALAMAGSVDESVAQIVAARVGHGWTAKRVMINMKGSWRKIDRAITKRDAGQRRKEGADPGPKSVGDADDDLITLF